MQIPLHRHQSERSGASAIFVSPGRDGHDWVSSVSRRVTNYNSLRHGDYRFVVRAEIPGGPSSEAFLRVRVAAAFLRDRLVPLCAHLLAAAGSGDSSACACGRSASVLRWCWMNGPAWRARSTIRWRKDSSASRRSWMRSRSHAQRQDGRRAPAPGTRAQDGAAQSHRGAALRDGSAGIGARGPRSSRCACLKQRVSGLPARPCRSM